ncbi:MAG: nitroreductase family protein [Deltaproteobacteria bacterium]|nr:nitroreductase family protein [Deltaproteobacteria bacterium]
MDVILTRRSVRSFLPDPVPFDLREALLRAAMSAPSGKGLRPWVFVVIDDRAVLDAIPEFHPAARMLLEAPLAIVVCGDLERDAGGYWVQDCSAAAENLLLAAHALGLGGVWLGVHTRPERERSVRDLLHLPSHVEPLCILALGYPAEVLPAEDRYDPARVHHNRW